ncbi:MAG: hemerythrin domain-containing protein [Methylocystis sp.]
MSDATSNEIDAKERKAIADQINFIRQELQKDAPETSVVLEALQKLVDMTKEHFKHEEDHMLIESYPGMLLHKRDHDYLVKGIKEFTASLVDNTVQLSPDLCEGLQSWLRYHMKRFDDAFVDFASHKS